MSNKYDEKFAYTNMSLKDVFNLELNIQARESSTEYEYICKGHFGVLCKVCGNPIIMKVHDHCIMEHTANDVDDNMFHAAVNTITCPKCKCSSDYDVLLDPAITPVLYVLNRRGYKTVFSCQGHNKQDDTLLIKNDPNDYYRETNKDSTAYIYFKDYSHSLHDILIQYPLPKSWYYNPNEEYNVFDFIIRAKTGIPINEYMPDIYEWAYSLPNISKFNTLSKTEILRLINDKYNSLIENIEKLDLYNK